MSTSKFRLRQRDKNIFWALYSCQALTTPQISAKFFSPQTRDAARDVRASHSGSSRCRTRLKQLCENEYLIRRSIPTTPKEGKKPYLYFLERKAVKLLAKESDQTMKEMDWRPEHNEIKFGKMAHLIAINDVRLSLGIATEETEYELISWYTERELKGMKLKATAPGSRGRMRRAALEPDAFFCLFYPSPDEAQRFTYPSFLEVDRGTEHVGMSSDKPYLNYFRSKVPRYLNFYRSGEYATHFEYEEMRVLTVTTDEARVHRLKSAAEELGGGEQFWFTTQEAITTPYQALMEPIWQVAGKPAKYPLVW